MKFRPFSDKYNRSDGDALVEHYPSYLVTPVSTWIQAVLWEGKVWYRTDDFIYTKQEIDRNFLNNLDLHFREHFPRESSEFLPFVFQDSDRVTEILNVCLQNYASPRQAKELERILATGGSAYSVMLTTANPESYARGIAEITRRVPQAVEDASKEAINNEGLIREAWIACYSHNPDYEKAVSRSCDVLEKIWSKYFPKDPKPQVKKFVHGLRTNPSLLKYKGHSVVSPKTLISDIAESFSDIRGQHSSGSGRAPTKDEAELVLHYTIFVWNLER